MKTVILAGGLGTRLAEETSTRPKPMVEIGGLPILTHIMEIYAKHGLRDFVVAAGYKGEMINDYFLNYNARSNDLEVNLSSGEVTYNHKDERDWKVRVVQTGQKTMTGGRIARLKSTLEDTGTFALTYGDGLANVDITALIEFHRKHGKLATMTCVRPPARFGTMSFEGDRITQFEEKPQTGEGWINGGFFVFEPGVFEYIEGDDTVFERAPLERLAADGELIAFRHQGFWKCMDMLRDKIVLQEMWDSGNAPWL